jgi:hypothetical protein
MRGPDGNRRIGAVLRFALYIVDALFCAAILAQPSAHAQTPGETISMCTNPICTPGKPCAEYQCPVHCPDCTPTPPAGTSCVLDYANGTTAYDGGGALPNVEIVSIDLFSDDGEGDYTYVGTDTSPVTSVTVSSFPNCPQVSGLITTEDPLAEYDDAGGQGTYSLDGQEVTLYDWPHVFYDDLDRDFDNGDYPYVFFGSYTIAGVDAGNGDAFSGTGAAELYIDADFYY